MKLVKISDHPEQYLNMDIIESVSKEDDLYYAYIIESKSSIRYRLTKEAYETILKYGTIRI